MWHILYVLKCEYPPPPPGITYLLSTLPETVVSLVMRDADIMCNTLHPCPSPVVTYLLNTLPETVVSLAMR